MPGVNEILPAGTRGGARVHDGWCFRRIHGETAGACRYAPISAAEFQTDQREISAPENCDEKVEGEKTFAEAVSEEVVSESPAHGLTPPTKQDCPAGVKDLESPARTILVYITERYQLSSGANRVFHVGVTLAAAAHLGETKLITWGIRTPKLTGGQN